MATKAQSKQDTIASSAVPPSEAHRQLRDLLDRRQSGVLLCGLSVSRDIVATRTLHTRSGRLNARQRAQPQLVHTGRHESGREGVRTSWRSKRNSSREHD